MSLPSEAPSRLAGVLDRHPKWKIWTAAIALAAVLFALFIVMLVQAVGSASPEASSGQMERTAVESGSMSTSEEGSSSEDASSPSEGAGLLGGNTVSAEEAAAGGAGKDGSAPSDSGGQAALTSSQENAFMAAKLHISEMPYSHAGLVSVLEGEGYSHDDAVFAVDRLNVDWNAKAVEMAAQYLDTMEFTRADLVDQLLYEGFSQEQAEAAATAVGL